MTVDLNYVLRAQFSRAAIEKTCGTETELIARPAAFFVRAKHEGDRDLHRVILLPPHGYTANTPTQMNAHDEAEFATIQVKGAIRDGKKAFSKTKDALLVASKYERGKVSTLDVPYLTYDLNNPDPDLITELHSSGTPPFPVVKPDKFGFYHNLVNNSNDWLFLVLHKRLRLSQPVNLDSKLTNVPEAQAAALRRLHAEIVLHGDDLFKRQPELVKDIARMPVAASLPALGEMLYTHDTGKHEACTAFGMILKLGKIDPDTVTAYLEESLKLKAIPPYYAQQLIAKINNTRNDPDEPKLISAL